MTSKRPKRHGSVYAFVLGIATLVTAIGVGALAAARFTARGAAASDDWAEAGVLAFSACEHALARMNVEAAASPYGWRANYTNGQATTAVALGRGTCQWALVDPADANLTNDYSQPLTLYGIGKVGKTTRVYSVTVAAGGQGLDVLRAAYHGNAGLTVGGTSIATGAPASSAAAATGIGTLRGDLDAASKGVLLTVSGAVANGAFPKNMPSSNVFTTYKASATALPSSAAAGGVFNPGSLTPTANPYGAANADGLYYLPLPAVALVQILPARVQGTLLIEGNSSLSIQTVQFVSEQYWKPQRADYPTLIVKGVRTVKFGGSLFQLSQSSTTYPSEMRGLIHLIGTTSVEMNNTFYLYGCLVADGTITTSGVSAVSWDPKLYATPPGGYQRGDVLTITPGSWKWDQLP